MLQSRNPLGMALQSSLMPGEDDWRRQQVGMLPQASSEQVPMSTANAPMAPRSKGQMIAGILSDGVKGFLGQQGTFGATLASEKQRQQQMQQEEAQWTRRRGAEREDKQWEWANKPKDADKPYRFQDNAGNLIELGPDGQPKTVFTDPTPKINYQRVNNPDGTFTMAPIPMGGAPASAPAAPVGKLTPLGGGASNGVGGFPRSR